MGSSTAIYSLALLGLTLTATAAEQFGDFTYEVTDDEAVTITDYPTDAVGEVDIPAEIDSKPVTSIKIGAFYGCTSLASISIPGSVTSIGRGALYGCTGLQAIVVDEGNPSYASVEGVFFDATLSTPLLYPAGRAGAYVIPPGVTTIGIDAFADCRQLTSVSIPSSVTGIGAGAFQDCSGMSAAIFLGDAPEFNENECEDEGCPVFWEVAPDFTIYYLSVSASFTSPSWCPSSGPWASLRGPYSGEAYSYSYSTVMLHGAPDEKETWLLGHGLALETVLHQDLNDDGVSLLMAYALDLNPRQNLRGRLPVPVLDGDRLGLTFPRARADLTYTVQTSTDLQNWTTGGVTTSDPTPDGSLTATVPRDTPQRFLRLVVKD